MKTRNFLKALFASFIMIAVIGLFSCEQPKPCEKNHTGDVKIYNSCSYRITVDVYSEDARGDGFLGERSISPGSSTTYTGVPAGPIEIWEDDAYSDWGYWDEYVGTCELFEFEIYSGKGATTIYLKPLPIETKTVTKEKSK